jgi:hypothetical protein
MQLVLITLFFNCTYVITVRYYVFITLTACIIAVLELCYAMNDKISCCKSVLRTSLISVVFNCIFSKFDVPDDFLFYATRRTFVIRIDPVLSIDLEWCMVCICTLSIQYWAFISFL